MSSLSALAYMAVLSVFLLFFFFFNDTATTEIYTLSLHDALPISKGVIWELWLKRGWVKEGRHYLKLGRNVQCKVCPNNCVLAPDDRSHCRHRINRDGTLYMLVYGNPCTLDRKSTRL